MERACCRGIGWDQTVCADAIEAIIDASIREQLEAERGVGCSFPAALIHRSLPPHLPSERQHFQRRATFPMQEMPMNPSCAKSADAVSSFTKIELTDDRIQEAASRLAMAYDEPFADASALPTLALTKEVAQTAQALSGDGGMNCSRVPPAFGVEAARCWKGPQVPADSCSQLGEALRSRTDHEAWVRCRACIQVLMSWMIRLAMWADWRGRCVGYTFGAPRICYQDGPRHGFCFGGGTPCSI